MASVTLTTLRARVRERADQPVAGFIADSATSLDALINEGVQELHDLLVSKYGNDYLFSSGSINLVAGTATYALPADFLKLFGIDAVFQGNTVALKPFVFAERNRHKNDGLAFPFQLPRYHIEGANIRFYPVPTAAMTLTVFYAPVSTLLVNAGDAVNFPNGWERYVVLDAAIKCLLKEESDASALMAEKAALKKHIEESAENRDAAAPQSAVDIEAVDESWWY